MSDLIAQQILEGEPVGASQVTSGAELPKVSVIVPVLDDPRIVSCVRGLLNQDYSGELLEIIVIDNGSRRPVHDVLSEFMATSNPSLNVISYPDGGSYAARNAGIAESAGSVLAFTDADCLPETQWLSRAVSALSSTADIAAGRVKVFARNPSRLHPIEAYELVHAFPQERYAERGRCACANMVTTRVLFDKVGPFRNIPSGGDMEWTERAHSMGHEIAYVHDAAVSHPARATFGEMRSKVHRVISSRKARDFEVASSAATSFPPLRNWVPPLGTLRRARKHPEFTTLRTYAALAVGETWHRYMAAWISTRVAQRNRRRLRRSPGITS